MKKVLNYYKNSSEIIKFAINISLLALAWFIFYGIFRHKEFINDFYEVAVSSFTQFLLESIKFSLEIIGYDVLVWGKSVKIIGSGGVFLDRGCLGRNVMGLYVGFVLAYPGIIKNKLWYIPLGVVIISIINIMRLGGLAIISKCCPEHIDINHHYVFKIIVFAIILLMWYFWVFKFSKSSKKEKKEDVELS